jgi:hypothetical protein
VATVSETLPIVAEHTGIKPATCTWVARQLVGSGLLPRSEGARVPQMDHLHLALLLIGLLSDATGATVVETTRRYAALVENGLTPDIALHLREPVYTAADYIEEMIAALADRDTDSAAGREAYGAQIEVVASWPEIRISFPNGERVVFVEPGTETRLWQSDKVRRSSTIAGVTLSNIVRDLARVPV